jgi:hypothetical protein
MGFAISKARLYLGRIACCHRHHWHPRRTTLAGCSASTRIGKKTPVRQQPKANGIGKPQFRIGEQAFSHGRRLQPTMVGRAKARYGYENGGWMYQLLPYIEEQALSDQRTSNGWLGGAAPISEQTISAYSCSTRGPRFGIKDGTDIVALSDYAGIVGSWSNPQQPAGHPWGGFEWDNKKNKREKEEENVWTGILSKGGHVNKLTNVVDKFTKVTMSRVKDGTSKTLFVLEKAAPLEFYNIDNSSCWPYWELMGYFHNADWMSMRKVATDIPLLRDSDQRFRGSPCSNGQYVEFGFGSPHSIVNAAYGDGSVRSLNFDVDWQIVDTLGRRADGGVVAEDF